MQKFAVSACDMDKINIRLAKSPEEREKVFKFRYSVYIEEMQRKSNYCDHQRKIIEEPLDETGYIYAAFDSNDKVVGTFRNNYLRDGGLGYYEKLYQLDKFDASFFEKISIITKLIILKQYRRRLVSDIMAAAFLSTLKGGVELNVIDTNSHLVKFFKHFGYKDLGLILHPEYGEVNLMVLELKNIEHLKSVNSPFYHLLLNHLQTNQ